MLRAFLFAIIAGPFVCWVIPTLWTPYFMAMGVYIAIVLAISFRESIRKRQVKFLLWMPTAFLTIRMGAGIGIVVETFSGLRRRRTICAV
jgi:hypothetical protein